MATLELETTASYDHFIDTMFRRSIRQITRLGDLLSAQRVEEVNRTLDEFAHFDARSSETPRIGDLREVAADTLIDLHLSGDPTAIRDLWELAEHEIATSGTSTFIDLGVARLKYYARQGAHLELRT